jgi:hypothetical protein
MSWVSSFTLALAAVMQKLALNSSMGEFPCFIILSACLANAGSLAGEKAVCNLAANWLYVSTYPSSCLSTGVLLSVL